MPIVNYEKNAISAEKHFLNSKRVSEPNKDYVRQFLLQYEVRPATRAKFCKHIEIFLRDLPDIKTIWHDRNKINKIYNQFRETQSNFSYYTIINVSKTFVRWLNEGEMPKGFIDVKSPSKKSQRRNLKESDMWSWEDGLKTAKHTRSIQIAAAFLLQLDAGFRPSELIDLKYGDVTIDKDILIFSVTGKTGARDVPTYRCVPEFLKWFEKHPTKKAKDPLWVTENGPGVNRIQYRNLYKHFEAMAKRAKINKPVDMYSLRHSSCFLDKMENYPMDLAADRHGHSTEFFSSVYGRLGSKDKAKRLRLHHGSVEERKKEQKRSIICSRCSHINNSDAELCYKCSAPLTLDKAMKMGAGQEKKLQQMEERMKKMEQAILKQALANEQKINHKRGI